MFLQYFIWYNISNDPRTKQLVLCELWYTLAETVLFTDFDLEQMNL